MQYKKNGKKLFFYSNHREDDLSIGITKKVHAQIIELRRRGFEVYFSAYYHKGIAIFNNDNKVVKYKQCPFFDGKLGHWIRRIDNLTVSRKFIIAFDKFDYVYMRFHFWDIYSLKFAHCVKSSGATYIVEAHAYPYKALDDRSLSMKAVYFLDDIFQKRVNRYIDLVAAITDKIENVWGCKTVQIENGINREDCKVRMVNDKNQGSINIVCVTNEASAHGLDRLLEGMRNYKGETEVFLWLIGEYFSSTKKLVDEYKLSEHVKLVGKKYGDELYDFYSKADLGVGPLAGYRYGHHMGTCLKTKEYFSVGLPFITCADKDADINKFPYVYVIPEDDTSVDINKVVEFIYNLGDSKQIAQIMHCYAKEHYGWEKEFDKIFNELSR